MRESNSVSIISLIGKVQGRPILTGPFQLESSVFFIGHLWELYVAMATETKRQITLFLNPPTQTTFLPNKGQIASIILDS